MDGSTRESPATPITETEVLIVGAGPTGLMLGCELRTRGVDCLLVERGQEIDPRTRAVMVHAASLERFEALGLREQLEARGITQLRIGFHALGRSWALDFTDQDTSFPYYLNVPQPEVEAILADAYRDLGGHLVRGVRYEEHREQGGQVVARLRSETGADDRTVAARWLVGADGSSSSVRGGLGVAFDGVTYPMSYLLAEGEPVAEPSRDESAMYIGARGAVSLLPMPDGTVRVAGPVARQLLDRDAALEFDEFQNIVDALGFGDRLRLARVDRLAHYQVHERLAERFRVGRVLLAGDAAHLNSPAGGQAMNTGFADATALAWRLARLTRSVDGVPALLDDYARERRAAAAEVARSTGVLPLLDAMRGASADGVEHAGTTGADGSGMHAVAAAERTVREGLARLADAWSQLYLTYPRPAEDDANARAVLGDRDTHRLRVGARVPMHAPDPHRFTLLLPPTPSASDVPGAAAAGLPPDTVIARQSPRQAAFLSRPAAVLVRPDGHVAAVLDPDGTGPHRAREIGLDTMGAGMDAANTSGLDISGGVAV
ncbi:FAD-dependent monooxygenase [Streptomyces mirabilis]|uniref:FAD-dependent monooxygenase n=1 Tax=Streptomyces mirabilis TaxID=68239 RepID=UPI00331B2D0E